MERDPVRFVWRKAPGLHILFVLLLIVAAVPAAGLAIELVRIALDDAIGGRAFANGPEQPFLRLVLQLPERIRDEDLVLFPGIPLARWPFALATVGALVAVAVVAALVTFVAGRIASAVEARAVGALRSALLEAVLGSRASADAEAGEAAKLAGPALTDAAAVLGFTLLTPLAAGMAVAVALLYGFALDWRFGMAVGAALIVVVLMRARQRRQLEAVASIRAAQGADHGRLLGALVRRLPAVRAHGAAGIERHRLAAASAHAQAALRRAERRVGSAAACAALAGGLPLVALIGVGAWLVPGLTPGQVAATGVGSAVAAFALDRLIVWREAQDRIVPLFDEIARTVASLQSRYRADASITTLPEAGTLALEGVSAYEAATGARISTVDVAITLPAHVAVVGDAEAPVLALAAVLAGQIEPSLGRVVFGGIELAQVDAAVRARRIAYAGGKTVFVPGTLRQNLLYGARETEGPETDRRLSEAAAVTGLDAFLHARGLSGTVDPDRDPVLAATVVDARRAVQAGLKADGLDRFVDPFDLTRYNRHGTIGENILFGMPLGDTFSEANLPSHPFLRAILEAEGLTKPLTAMGLAIAESTLEIFADVPDGHPLFQRFSFFSAPERGYYEDLVERQNERRRGAEPGRDRERLIELALRYSESRHRLGLLDAAMEQRIIAARAAFAQMLPMSLRPAIEFYDPQRLCAAASLQDNLLFGRIAHDQAGAEQAVYAVIRRVLTARGLDSEVVRIGLETRVDPSAGDLSGPDAAAIDLARCLVRRPEILVVERALLGLPRPSAVGLLRRLRHALIGRGLIVVVPDLGPGIDPQTFDAIIRVERGSASLDRRQTVPEPAVA
jgi:ABC-type multidrug transport system fused ATPase/permease subunit